MTNKSLSVGVLTGCKSDIHLSERIITELRKLCIFASYITLKQNNIIESYDITQIHINTNITDQYNLILAVGDRPEQLGGVLCAFHNKIPIGHLYAGDTNTIATFDDIDRHAISLYSNIQFCSCNESRVNIINFMSSIKLIPNAYIVGATHFDNIDIGNINKEYISCRYRNNNKYILVSLNSETLGNNEKMLEETALKIKQIGIKTIYLTEGNTDDNLSSTEIEKLLVKLINDESYIILNMERLDHYYYIYLIMHCKEYITNSSSGIYEAPYLIPQNVIHIVGNRNKGRTKIPKQSYDGKASFRVANLINTFLEEMI